MRLTKTIREAFVRAAIADVPTTDYLQLVRDAVLADLVAKLPPKVRAVWDDPKLRHWVNTDWGSFYRVSVTHPSMRNSQTPALSSETDAKCAEWMRLHKEQESSIRKLRDSLSAAAESMTTRKGLAELLPEFEKYLPEDEKQALRTVPAIANLVADFSKAGWPKGKKSDATSSATSQTDV